MKVLGTSCGLGVSGSGWVVRRNLVATNVHVVTGEQDTHVLTPAGGDRAATLVYVDARNDVALLRVPGLRTAPLAAAPESDGPRPVALLGYPGDGPLVAEPGTAGSRQRLLGRNAYGEAAASSGRSCRFEAPVRSGDSGGPAVDGRGRVVAMMFAATRGSEGGYGIPVDMPWRQPTAGFARSSRENARADPRRSFRPTRSRRLRRPFNSVLRGRKGDRTWLCPLRRLGFCSTQRPSIERSGGSPTRSSREIPSSRRSRSSGSTRAACRSRSGSGG